MRDRRGGKVFFKKPQPDFFALINRAKKAGSPREPDPDFKVFIWSTLLDESFFKVRGMAKFN